MLNATQQLKQFRAKRLAMLANTPIYDADNKIARTDAIELYLWRKALVEISNNLFIFNSLKP